MIGRVRFETRLLAIATLAAALCLGGWLGHAQSPLSTAGLQGQPSGSGQPQLVWIDTDIGDDIDDAFALALILRSPELKVLGLSTAFGDTETRASLVDRFLTSIGEAKFPVTAGVHTDTNNVMTQAAYAKGDSASLQRVLKHANGVTALLQAIDQHPGQVTLIALGPLFNVGAAIDRDPMTFRKLKRVVMMGGSIARGYDGPNGETRPLDAEWNINRDPRDASKLLAAGVPLYLMPLDSTQIHLQTAQREAILGAGSALTDQLAVLYHQWVAHTESHSPTPTLFDPVAVAYAIRPELCPTEPMRLVVDDKGFTRKIEGPANAQVCLKSDEGRFLKIFSDRVTAK
jgi:inosine-uridine nucleoside N-ribohydrolase